MKVPRELTISEAVRRVASRGGSGAVRPRCHADAVQPVYVGCGMPTDPDDHEARIAAHAERVGRECREVAGPPRVRLTNAEKSRLYRRRNAYVPEAVWYCTPLGVRLAVVKLVNCRGCRRVLCGESMRCVKGATDTRLPPLVAGRGECGEPLCVECLLKGEDSSCE